MDRIYKRPFKEDNHQSHNQHELSSSNSSSDLRVILKGEVVGVNSKEETKQEEMEEDDDSSANNNFISESD